MSAETQTSDTVLMVRPARFAFHAEAARSNAFASDRRGDRIHAEALAEFDALRAALEAAGVRCLVLDGTPDPAPPDAVFPNNWVSFHGDGSLVLYPMATEARRLERDLDGLTALLAESGLAVRQVIDLSFHERHGHFLEGTGSLVLDRPGRRAYASRSPRTDPVVIAEFDDRLDFSTLIFDARDPSGQPIYHTNVLMSLGTDFAILCSEAVDDAHRDLLIGEIEAGERTLIDVDYDQLRQFACNLIELRNSAGEPVIALSSAALASFRPDQRRSLERCGELLTVPIPTIEQVGGGSVRCMIADVHLPKM